ncbi:hypothetical protein [Enterococcus massiliensis]|uniref:hypothetical protein n=1 Tax=Enterococcus massiliensis TaxID=1640685 RepID=UPI00065E07B2|nr:hypothetical protein [Enterococcus massiliensis]
MEIEKYYQEYLEVLKNRKSECITKIKELEQEAMSYEDDENQELYYSLANVWRIKVDTLNFAIWNFKEIVMSQC